MPISDMATIADRILDAIRYAPLDDDVLAKRLGISQRQSVNQVARRLEREGLVTRYTGPDGKIVNALADGVSLSAPRHENPPVNIVGGQPITEDEVKEAVREHLAAQGFQVRVAWGRSPGIDIEAVHPDGRRYVIEAKAEKGVTGPQQHNYFVGMLGELVQRMSDPHARYGIALPENSQYRGLVGRLPAEARERLGLVVFWVRRSDGRLALDVEDAR